VIGDRRPYIVALLTLDTSGLKLFATRHGLTGKIEELIRHPRLIAEVQGRVEAVNISLANVEKVRRWLLLPREFIVGVELTPTFKIRRKVVSERFAAEIESMYSTKSETGRHDAGGA
jgi:long-chain acyl-CoA synthetase